jgi:hypothetical protein
VNAHPPPSSRYFSGIEEYSRIPTRAPPSVDSFNCSGLKAFDEPMIRARQPFQNCGAPSVFRQLFRRSARTLRNQRPIFLHIFSLNFIKVQEWPLLKVK